jgi:excisionase family DNA binding protein
MKAQANVPSCPPWQGIRTLAANLDLSRRTIEAYVKEGKLPAPRMLGGKRLWNWSEVEDCLHGRASEVASEPDDLAERLYQGARAEAERSRRPKRSREVP